MTTPIFVCTPKLILFFEIFEAHKDNQAQLHVLERLSVHIESDRLCAGVMQDHQRGGPAHFVRIPNVPAMRCPFQPTVRRGDEDCYHQTIATHIKRVL